jgi:copper chaperone CopZ
MYPIISLDHEGFHCDNELVVIKDCVKIVRAKKNLCKLAEDVRIKLYAVDIKEYGSNTGHHRVDAVFIKPFMMTRNYDFYVAEPLYIAEFKRKRYATPYEIFNVAVLHYMSENPDKIMPSRIGAFCWRVSLGYYKCLLVRPVSVEEFLAEAEEFTVENLFDILPHL